MFLKSVELRDEEGGAHVYDYYVTIDELNVGPFACESYGMKVVERGGSAAALVPHVTCDIGRIDELSDLVVSNGVTPENLLDVVTDWL